MSLSKGIQSAAAAALSAAMLIALAACGTTDSTDTAAKSGDSSKDSSSTSIQGFDTSSIQKDDEIAALLPDSVTSDGTLTVGADTSYAPAEFLSHFTVFVLACFVGYMVVWNVTPALHTPLMSVTNAISSIIAIGALVQVAPPLTAAGAADRPNALILGLAVFALVLTAVNMFGGFAVTRRMLAMFRK